MPQRKYRHGRLPFQTINTRLSQEPLYVETIHTFRRFTDIVQVQSLSAAEWQSFAFSENHQALFYPYTPEAANLNTEAL